MAHQRRLSVLSRHVVAPAAAARPAAAAKGQEALPPPPQRPPKLLSDAEVQAFVRDGMVAIAIPEDELPSSHHALVYDTASALRDGEGNASQGDVWDECGPLIDQV
jgi:hypothetical protein